MKGLRIPPPPHFLPKKYMHYFDQKNDLLAWILRVKTEVFIEVEGQNPVFKGQMETLLLDDMVSVVACHVGGQSSMLG